MEYRGQEAIKREIELVKAGIAAAGASVDDFFFPSLGPGWVGHFLWKRILPDGRRVRGMPWQTSSRVTTKLL